MLNSCFLTQKRHILALNHVVWRILRANRFRSLGCGWLEEPGKKKPGKHFWCAISRIRGKETPWEVVAKFCVWVDIKDLIKCATFGDDRLRGLGVARGRISHFPIDLRRRPYNLRTTMMSVRYLYGHDAAVYECLRVCCNLQTICLLICRLGAR